MKTKRVLLVDDENDFLQVMSLRIQSWGYKVVCASGGKQALEMFSKDKPDIVILDYMMPGMDGIATLKEIRKLNKKIPVIMFTAYPMEKAIDAAIKLKVSTFVPKFSAYVDIEKALRSALKIAEGNPEVAYA